MVISHEELDPRLHERHKFKPWQHIDFNQPYLGTTYNKLHLFHVLNFMSFDCYTPLRNHCTMKVQNISITLKGFPVLFCSPSLPLPLASGNTDWLFLI